MRQVNNFVSEMDYFTYREIRFVRLLNIPSGREVIVLFDKYLEMYKKFKIAQGHSDSKVISNSTFLWLQRFRLA